MWPDGKRCAAAFTFDFDAESVWIADDPENANRPGILSQGTYGARVAVPLILELLERQGVRATFFVPGIVAETYPQRVSEIVAGGHELAVHGYTHTSPTDLSAEAEADELTRAKAALERFSDRVVGYRSPAWDFSSNTLGLLDRFGFRYSTNMMDDIRPYLHPDTGVVELPVQWVLDDAAHFWFSAAEWTKSIAAPSQVDEIWRGELEGIRRLGGCCIFTMHPQVIGRPGRLPFLEALIEHAVSSGDIWVTTMDEMSEQARRSLAAAV
ncbi:MAG: polysaccharide deacetylase family protein [Gaiellales bacterium]